MGLSAVSFPNPNEERYILTSDDIIAINEMMDTTHAVQIRISSHEREASQARKQMFIFAPGHDKTWYTGQGDTICEAADNWFEKTRLRRWDVSAHRIERGWDYLPG